MPALFSAKTTSANDSLKITADAQFRYAEHCYENKDYAQAATEYKQFIYFFPDDPRIDSADYKIGVAWFLDKSYLLALKRFTAIFDQKGATGTGISAAFMISRCYQKIGNYDAAIENLIYLQQLTDNRDVEDRIAYHIAWLYLDTGNVEQAKTAFSGIRPEHRKNFNLDKISADLNEFSQLPRKNPVIAGILSVIPGGGYLYCGRYRDALTAFLINSALIYGAYESFDNELYAIGGLITALETGFYAGNIYGGISSAHKFNRAQENAFVQQLKKRFLLEAGPDLSLKVGPDRIGMGLVFRF